MAREKRARASSSRSRAAPEPEPEPEPIAVEFDQNRYRNREAADRFSAQLSSPLTPGLRLDTPFLFNIGVLRCLQDCYLDRLTDRNTILYYPDAIRLFYANLTWNISSESCTLTSYVFGRRISFSQSRLATLLDLPDSGFSFSLDMIPVAGQSHWFDRPFSIEEQLRHTLHCRQVRVASKPSLRDLPPLSRLFHHIIAHNVIPRTGGLSLVSYLDVQLLTFFRSGTPLNLPRLIMLNMIRSASHPALAIPYGLLLTHILAAFDIPLLGEYIEVTRHIVLDCSTLRRKGLLDDRNRLLPEPELENVIVDADDDDDDEADDDGDDDDADGDDDAADADDDAGGDAGDGFDRDPPPLIIPSTHEAGTSSGPSTSGYEAILTRLDMMQQHMHTGFSRMDLAHSQLSRRLSRMEDHCGIQCPEEDIFHPPPPSSGDAKVTSIKTQSLRRKLEDLKMKDFESMKDFFSRTMEVVNQMRIAKLQIIKYPPLPFPSGNHRVTISDSHHARHHNSCRNGCYKPLPSTTGSPSYKPTPFRSERLLHKSPSPVSQIHAVVAGQLVQLPPAPPSVDLHTGDRTKPLQRKDISASSLESGSISTLSESDEDFANRLEDWDSINHRIITWFSNTSIASINMQFGCLDTAKEAWDTLAQR
ncbi:hypothetical protein RJ639_021022 [Escallonia herrerae]|uniref:Putative plant transposon protein domain-containing protein n=1 Tax=Escallonia herrerae TaxID=1293975 RepID=A0AA88V2Q4_9ASTE|nr:hypothetical protein RJ639_021022 [Escallonia herrerae]